MGSIFFKAAPIGDPNDKKGRKLLTTEVSKLHRPDEGMLRVLVHDQDVDWIECFVSHGGLVLCGMTSYGVADAEEMLRLLDKALCQDPDWKTRRKCILPKPDPTDEPEVTVEPVAETKAAKVKP